MRARLRTLVETEHAGDDALELRRNGKCAAACAKLAPPAAIAPKFGTEGRVELRDRAYDHDRAPCRIDALHGEAGLCRKPLDCCQIIRARTAHVREFFPAEIAALAQC
jgi:hypothetical protein